MMDGSTYGIPVGFTTHCLFYNKDIFDEAGVEYPTEDWTWDDLQEAARRSLKRQMQKDSLSR